MSKCGYVEPKRWGACLRTRGQEHVIVEQSEFRALWIEDVGSLKAGCGWKSAHIVVVGVTREI